MKKTAVVLTLLVLSTSLIAQNDPRLASFKKETDQLRASLLANAYANEEEKKLVVDFKIETFTADKLLESSIDADNTTVGMIEALREAEVAYDKLLNKYYKLLIAKLAEPDKETLRQSQRNWIKFRDGEKLLISTLLEDNYTGGGTMYQVEEASANLDLTKERVQKLFSYLHDLVGER